MKLLLLENLRLSTRGVDHNSAATSTAPAKPGERSEAVATGSLAAPGHAISASSHHHHHPHRHHHHRAADHGSPSEATAAAAPPAGFEDAVGGGSEDGRCFAMPAASTAAPATPPKNSLRAVPQEEQPRQLLLDDLLGLTGDPQAPVLQVWWYLRRCSCMQQSAPQNQQRPSVPVATWAPRSHLDFAWPERPPALRLPPPGAGGGGAPALTLAAPALTDGSCGHACGAALRGI